MTTPIPRPRRPEDLPAKWLRQRDAREPRWEGLDRAGEEKLRDIQAWAEEELTKLFMSQELGSDHRDPAYVARINDLYDTIRNSLTRQDLIMGFLINIQTRAQENANARMEDFQRDLRDITGI